MRRRRLLVLWLACVGLLAFAAVLLFLLCAANPCPLRPANGYLSLRRICPVDHSAHPGSVEQISSPELICSSELALALDRTIRYA
jgi:hypothetical protein